MVGIILVVRWTTSVTGPCLRRKNGGDEVTVSAIGPICIYILMLWRVDLLGLAQGFASRVHDT